MENPLYKQANSKFSLWNCTFSVKLSHLWRKKNNYIFKASYIFIPVTSVVTKKLCCKLPSRMTIYFVMQNQLGAVCIFVINSVNG